jgi:DNA-binding response OmpR family regulator
VGSTFSAEIPLCYAEAGAIIRLSGEAWQLKAGRLPVLVVEDEVETQLVYEKYLQDTIFQPIPARTIREAQEVLRQIQPGAIILDILLPGEEAWTWLTELKGSDATRSIPVIIVTSVEDPRKGLALGADAYQVKPFERQVGGAAHRWFRTVAANLLVIDDEEPDVTCCRRCWLEHPIQFMPSLPG